MTAIVRVSGRLTRPSWTGRSGDPPQRPDQPNMPDGVRELRPPRRLEIASELALPDPERGGVGLDPELETTVYRLVQEALTNIVKHARANTVRVSVGLTDGEVIVEVQDDGVGFDAEAQTTGFGLAGMRERVYLAGGTLHLHSGEPGTLLSARLPVKGPGAAGARSSTDQMAS
jgi:signal transduction histidine kinase